MRHFKLVVQYDGTGYAGFQRQPDRPTVQGEIEKALEGILGEPSRIVGAGRTDAGVHATGQVIRVSTDKPIPCERLVEALNDSLPRAICVSGGQEVGEEFHPQYSAIAKTYSYQIMNRNARSPFLELWAWHIRQRLDVDAMQQAGDVLVGEHDFAAFAASGGSACSTVRTVTELSCRRLDEGLVQIRITGNGFLYMMVRNVVGTLVEVGLGRRSAESMSAVLASRDRGLAGATAPAHGLCLCEVIYE